MGVRISVGVRDSARITVKNEHTDTKRMKVLGVWPSRSLTGREDKKKRWTE